MIQGHDFNSLPLEDLEYDAHFVELELLEQLKREIFEMLPAFQVEQIPKEDGWIPTPRLIASFSDRQFDLPGARPSIPVPDSVRRLCEAVSVRTAHPFNYVLTNWYRDGRDFTGWHPDKAHFHEPDSKIAVVSLGAVRHFLVRDQVTKRPRADIAVAEGSLLLMSMALQGYTEHTIPPVDTEIGPRVSLTLRQLRT